MSTSSLPDWEKNIDLTCSLSLKSMNCLLFYVKTYLIIVDFWKSLMSLTISVESQAVWIRFSKQVWVFHSPQHTRTLSQGATGIRWRAREGSMRCFSKYYLSYLLFMLIKFTNKFVNDLNSIIISSFTCTRITNVRWKKREKCNRLFVFRLNRMVWLSSFPTHYSFL